MVTLVYAGRYNRYCGNSDDDIQHNEAYKVNMPNGSIFDEIDTSKQFRFDAEHKKWVIQKNAESGGGQSHTDGENINISLPDVWEGDGPYTQTVTITGYATTANTRADIVQDDAVVAQMIRDGVETIYIENDNNVFTAYAVGGKPSAAYNLTIVLTEVS